LLKEIRKMPLIRFVKNGVQKNVTVPENSTILQGIRKAGISFELPCSGFGLCGKCKVAATGELEQPTSDEMKFIDQGKNERLACCAKVKGEVCVEFICREKKIQTINSGFARKAGIDSNIKLVDLGAIEAKSSTPFSETIKYEIKDVDLYKKISELEADKNLEAGSICGVIWNNELIDLFKEKREILAAAVDIGTTGISAYLIDLESGEILNKLSSLNPQTEYGGDVISRISWCMTHQEGTKLLQKLISDELNRLMRKLTDGRFSAEQIYNIVVAGNTTMLHLLAGINPSSMAVAPYRPVLLNSATFRASEIGISINEGGRVTLLPGVSAYVGADIIAGISATEFNKNKKNSIFIDIGTNGEIAAISGGKMVCTSTAAGPALEGMNISCGCRAEKGAIESFDIDENYNVTYATIEGTEPVGICGSGLIDMAGSLVKRGIVSNTGSFNKNMDQRVMGRFREKKFYITDKIYISQKDIRQIQLAKGAIAAGIKMLLEKINITVDDLEEVIIAGAFGYHIDEENILNIGLIPKGFNGEISFVGNTSIEGARLAAVNKSCLIEMEAVQGEMEALELSTDSRFQDYFIAELNF
jgi:uncharacterized 2Fe-2S/4Fe-4S cluster protein (DUF4445 family)